MEEGVCVSVCVPLYLGVSVCVTLYTFVLPGSSDGKESACNAGDPDSIPGGVGKIPCSALKGETVPDSLPATPKPKGSQASCGV